MAGSLLARSTPFLEIMLGIGLIADGNYDDGAFRASVMMEIMEMMLDFHSALLIRRLASVM